MKFVDKLRGVFFFDKVLRRIAVFLFCPPR